MLGLFVPALWIVFDVLICLRTGYMNAPFPRWEFWTWLTTGIVLAVMAFASEIMDHCARKKERRSHEEETRRLNTQIADFEKSNTSQHHYQAGQMDVMIKFVGRDFPKQVASEITGGDTNKLVLAIVAELRSNVEEISAKERGIATAQTPLRAVTAVINFSVRDSLQVQDKADSQVTVRRYASDKLEARDTATAVVRKPDDTEPKSN